MALVYVVDDELNVRRIVRRPRRTKTMKSILS
jgi:hypothetical protein